VTSQPEAGPTNPTDRPQEQREIVEVETKTVQADRVVMTRSAAREVSAREARLDSSATVLVEATEATVVNSACVQVLAESASVSSSPALMIAAERAVIRESPVFLFLGSVEGGEVRPTLDWRGAVGLGAAFGAALALVGALLRRRAS
jgi:hypothetical protein